MRKVNDCDREQISNIVDSPKVNALYEKKTVSSYIVVLVIGILFFLALFFIPFKISEKETILISIIGSIFSSLIILFLTLSNEKRKSLIKGKKSAKVLAESLSLIETQIIQINNGSRHQIYYPSNWIEYYIDCSFYLKYDYLEYLYSEFNFVEQINYCLKSEDDLQRIIEHRRNQFKNNPTSFNILEIYMNLELFARGKAENEPWNQSKNYKLFSNYFNRYYKEDILNLTVTYLEKNGKSKVFNVQSYVMEQLRLDLNFLKEQFNEYHHNDRAILNEIFKIFLELNKNSTPFSLIWGEMSLKNA